MKAKAAGLDDLAARVWDLKSRAELCTLTGHTVWVRAVAVTPDGRRTVSASSDQTLKVWDLESGKLIATFSADGALSACAVASDGSCSKGSAIVAGGASGRVHFFAFGGGQITETLMALISPGGFSVPAWGRTWSATCWRTNWGLTRPPVCKGLWRWSGWGCCSASWSCFCSAGSAV